MELDLWGTEIKDIEALIEGLLFASGDEMTADRISEIIGVDKKTVKSILTNMVQFFKTSKRGVMLREINGAYQLCTRFEHYEYIKKLFEPRQKQGLSQAAFETLSIIAYNQPVTKTKVESIRGVSSESSVEKLLDRNLIREAGRMDGPGKPILYETTVEFLRSFGLNSHKELREFELAEERKEESQ